MEKTVEMCVAIVVTIILGLGVRPFLECATRETRPDAPDGVDPVLWNHIVHRASAGGWLGFFERLISLAAFWMEAYVIIAGWLAFKVASKWEIWRNVIQVPSKLDEVPDLTYLRARNAWGSWIFTRFLIGTLMNVLIGLGATYVGQHTFEAIGFIVGFGVK